MADRTDNPTRTNLLGIPETLLGEDFVDVEVSAELADGDPREVATRHPDSPLAWATLAQEALEDDDVVSAYAFARTGYHRGLDALRRAGWRGQGPIPASMPPTAASCAPWRCWGRPPAASATRPRPSGCTTSCARPTPACWADREPAGLIARLLG